MKSKAAIGGHPIHPALVSIPIGLFIAAFAADLVYLADDRDKMWYDIAFWAGNAAIVTALIAAVAGAVDYFGVAQHTTARGYAQAHAVMNVTVVGLYAVAAALMMDEGALDGGALAAVIALHGVGTAILAVSGWIGGEMVFRDHIGMIPDDGKLEQEEADHHTDKRRRAA